MSAISRRVIGICLLLILILLLPTRAAQGRVENASIEWLVDQPDYKEAVVSVVTHNGTYHVIIKANITIYGPETYINITAALNPEGFSFNAAIAIPDLLYDAPYTSQSVPAFHIHFPPWAVEALKAILVFVIIFAMFYFFEALLDLISSGLSALLQQNHFFVWASLPWVFLTIFSQDQNDDGSLNLYIPYDEEDLALLPDNYIIATARSWWLITEQEFSFLFLHFTWYSARWLQERVQTEIVNQPPWASFEWAPNTPNFGQTVVFTSTSFDPDGTIEAHHWWFGDGSEAFGENVTHVYTRTGLYEVVLEVTDNDGSRSRTSTSMMGVTFNVVPEVPLGIITTILAMLTALGFFIVYPRNINFKRWKKEEPKKL